MSRTCAASTSCACGAVQFRLLDGLQAVKTTSGMSTDVRQKINMSGFRYIESISLAQERVAGELGLEPRLTESESVVLPLDDSPIEGFGTVITGQNGLGKWTSVFRPTCPHGLKAHSVSLSPLCERSCILVSQESTCARPQQFPSIGPES